MGRKAKISRIRLFGRADALLIAASLSLAALLAYIYTAPAHSPLKAEITVNGELYKTVYLTDAPKETIVIQTDPAVTLSVRDGKISFINALCADRLCEKRGALDRAGGTAVCLPARVVVTVISDKSGEADFDAVSY